MNNYVVIDIETSGLDPKTSEIIKASALKVKNGEITERFSEFVKPGKTLPREVVQLTGINEKSLKNARTAVDILPDLIKFIGDYPVVAHNVGFHLKFVKSALKKLKLPPIKNETVDTLVLAYGKFSLENYALRTVAKSLAIDGSGMSDEEITFNVYEKLK